MRGTTVAYEDPTLLVAVHRSLMLVRWCDAPTLAQARAFSRLSYELARAEPRGSALLNVIVRGTPPFTDGVRDEVVRMTSDATLFTLGAAHLVLLSGLASTAVRAFLSTMLLLGRPKNPARVFGDAGSAADWLSERLALGAAPLLRTDILALHGELLARPAGSPSP